MSEHKIKSPSKDVPLSPVFHTILAAENKTSELFVKSFQYQGENIATKHLGQIFGFFEIPDTQEDNAYIVNFLASVVKKEYFINPKRSASDSFEAALHKINLALTELVKQGNTGWLGKIHGVVCVIERSAFHFSVTGDAAILLYRDQQVTLISEGLADKDAALHPLKTFLEISSGALIPQDKILITSPELFTLCDSETLRKNAFRMDKNGFARYVRAALVNELPLGVSTIIDIELAPLPSRPKKKAAAIREESREKLQNVFSSAPFIEPEPRETTEVAEEGEGLPLEDLLPSEYTDKKTGHIYVQGEAPNGIYKEPGFFSTFIEETLRPLSQLLGRTFKRFTKKSRKTVSKQALVIGAGGKELSQNLWKLSKEKGALLASQSRQALKARMQSLKERREQKKSLPQEEDFLAPENDFVITEEFTEDVHLAPSLPEEGSSSLPDYSTPEIPEDAVPLSKRQEALKRFSASYQAPQKRIPPQASFNLLAGTAALFSSLFARIQNFFIPFSRTKKIILGVLLLLVLVGSISPKIYRSFANKEVLEQTSPEPSALGTVPAPAVPELNAETTLTSWSEGESILLVAAENNMVVVTPKTIIFNGKVIPFVANGTIKSATYMTDLRMLFLWSTSNELVSWSLVDQKFTANNLPLPANTEVSGLGAYLTYLYVLDKNAGTIYRFARTDGGFSEPTTWLRTALPKESARAFVVNDTIRIATDTAIDQYLRGTKEKTISEESYQVLGSSNNKTFTLGVETSLGKITIWDGDGNAVYEGSFDELKGISGVAYNESNKKLSVTKDQNLREYSLQW